MDLLGTNIEFKKKKTKKKNFITPDHIIKMKNLLQSPYLKKELKNYRY